MAASVYIHKASMMKLYQVKYYENMGNGGRGGENCGILKNALKEENFLNIYSPTYFLDGLIIIYDYNHIPLKEWSIQ